MYNFDNVTVKLKLTSDGDIVWRKLILPSIVSFNTENSKYFEIIKNLNILEKDNDIDSLKLFLSNKYEKIKRYKAGQEIEVKFNITEQYPSYSLHFTSYVVALNIDDVYIKLLKAYILDYIDTELDIFDSDSIAKIKTINSDMTKQIVEIQKQSDALSSLESSVQDVKDVSVRQVIMDKLKEFKNCL